MGIHLFKTSSTPAIAEISKEKSDAWLTTISGKSIGKLENPFLTCIQSIKTTVSKIWTA